MNKISDVIGHYDANASELARRYESQPFEEIHADALPHLPHEPAAVLDVGAGSGRDAAWFAVRGHDVMAIEPADGLRAEAARLHPNPNIRWLQDSLPGLDRVRRSGAAFDLIWLSAVWMHVAPRDRERAFRKVASFLRAGGRMMISLRHGPAPPDRRFHEVSVEEIRKLARRFGLVVVSARRSDDRLGREDV